MYPAWAMLEYARRRVKLFCINAATLPKVMVTTATIAKVEYQSTWNRLIPMRKTRKAAAKDAIFAPAARRAAIVVGAPSKASGIHMWKGTTAILTPNPTMNMTMASTPKARVSAPMLPKELAIVTRFVDPVMPKTRDMA